MSKYPSFGMLIYGERYNIVWANSLAVELLTAEKSIGKSIFDILSRKCFDYLKTQLSADEREYIESVFIDKQTGEEIHLRIYISEIYLSDRRYEMLSFQPITDLDLNDELSFEYRSKLSQIAWKQSHEVRHSLCKILGIFDLLKVDDENEKFYLDLMEAEVQRLDILSKEIGHIAYSVAH